MQNVKPGGDRGLDPAGRGASSQFDPHNNPVAAAATAVAATAHAATLRSIIRCTCGGAP